MGTLLVLPPLLPLQTGCPQQEQKPGQSQLPDRMLVQQNL
jgi:hypothetical protein